MQNFHYMRMKVKHGDVIDVVEVVYDAPSRTFTCENNRGKSNSVSADKFGDIAISQPISLITLFTKNVLIANLSTINRLAEFEIMLECPYFSECMVVTKTQWAKLWRFNPLNRYFLNKHWTQQIKGFDVAWRTLAEGKSYECPSRYTDYHLGSHYACNVVIHEVKVPFNSEIKSSVSFESFIAKSITELTGDKYTKIELKEMPGLQVFLFEPKNYKSEEDKN